jgi:hypothetical protein
MQPETGCTTTHRGTKLGKVHNIVLPAYQSLHLVQTEGVNKGCTRLGKIYIIGQVYMPNTMGIWPDSGQVLVLS